MPFGVSFHMFYLLVFLIKFGENMWVTPRRQI